MKIGDIVGIPVFINSKKIGNIKETVINFKEAKIEGFLLEKKNLEFSKKYIPYKCIKVISKDNVVINCNNDVKKWKIEKEKKNEKDFRIGVIGLELKTVNHYKIGRISDLYFNTITGEVEKLEITEGCLMDDLINGRKIIPLIGKVEFSEDFLTITKEALEEMSHSGGGLKNIINKE